MFYVIWLNHILIRIILETKNFDTGRELLLVSCPVKDDPDYEHIHLDACSIATQDLKNWLEENNIPLNILLVGVNLTKVNLKIQ